MFLIEFFTIWSFQNVLKWILFYLGFLNLSWLICFFSLQRYSLISFLLRLLESVLLDFCSIYCCWNCLDLLSIWLLGLPSGALCPPDPSFEENGNIPNYTVGLPLPTSLIDFFSICLLFNVLNWFCSICSFCWDIPTWFLVYLDLFTCSLLIYCL